MAEPESGSMVPVDLAECQAMVNGLPEEETEYQHDIGQIERDLDTLTLSGSTINDLELRLMRTRELYRRSLDDCKQRLEGLRRRLQTSITKTEPFVDMWRRARQIQELSNRMVAKYDKAASQHAAAREMITVAEEKLGTKIVNGTYATGSNPSALDLAWQEMLNHATTKVVETERERRDSELEHKMILEQVTAIMEEYRLTERRLRSYIVKSRPYFEERFKSNLRLQQIKRHIQGLEGKIRESKRVYSATLGRLETLNVEIHERRRSYSALHTSVRGAIGDERKSSSASNTPELRKREQGGSDAESLESLQLGDMRGEFTGSTGSLPSIGISSVSDYCPTPEPANGADSANKTVINGGDHPVSTTTDSKPSPPEAVSTTTDSKPSPPEAVSTTTDSKPSPPEAVSTTTDSKPSPPEAASDSKESIPMSEVKIYITQASERDSTPQVTECLEGVAAKLEEENRTPSELPHDTNGSC